MPRSAGVTASAVIVFIGSAFTALMGALMGLAGIVVMNSPRRPALPPNFHFLFQLEAAVILAFAAWGFASGVGLVKLKPWARISIIVYAVMLLFFCLPIACLMLVVPLSAHGADQSHAAFVTGVRLGLSGFYFALAALGGFWLYLFNASNVKAQFSLEPAIRDDGFPQTQPADAQFASSNTMTERPLSISIIGWFLLVGSAFAPLWLIYSSRMYPNVELPFFFVGFFLHRFAGQVTLMLWSVVQALAAIGLLRLKNWARILTLALQGLAVLNMLLLTAVPSNVTKLQQMTDQMSASLAATRGYPPGVQPIPAAHMMPAIMISIVPMFAAIIYFLIARRSAFKSGW